MTSSRCKFQWREENNAIEVPIKSAQLGVENRKLKDDNVVEC